MQITDCHSVIIFYMDIIYVCNYSQQDTTPVLAPVALSIQLWEFILVHTHFSTHVSINLIYLAVE